MNRRGSLTRRLVLSGRALAAWRPTWRWLVGVVRGFLVSFAALGVTLWVVPGEQVPEGGTEAVATLVVTVLVVGALLRPFLTALTVLTGVAGLLVIGFLAQTIILGVALSLVPGIEPIPVPELVVVAWCVAVVAAVLNWLVDTSSEEVFHGQVMGRAVRTARQREVSGPGLLVIQLDGVAQPLLRQAAAAGAMPFLTRMVRSGEHRLRGWHTGLPSTTPAGQAVLLHGQTAPIPAFRWYDKQRGRVLECSKPADAGVIEGDFARGDGLLSQDGVSVANQFSGDAAYYALTMSHPRLPGSERGAAAFAAARSGFARSFVMLVGQIAVELYQGRRQRLRNVVPRVPRRGAFVLLRGLTTVVLRDLAVSIVADQMARGAPVIYVDFVDYDEVAHHAGPTRPESLRTLESLDNLIGFFTELSAEVGRDYEIAIVSDHGQTQGSTFLQLEGRTLADAVRGIVEGAPRSRSHGTPAETLGPANLLRASGRRTLLPPRLGRGREDGADRHDDVPNVEVVASGSIAHLYLTGEPGRLSRDVVDRLVPSLVPGLCAIESVGVVMTRDAAGVLRVENGRGHRLLTADGCEGGEGEDPLAAYGDLAAADLYALEAKHHVGDVVVLGRFDPVLTEVAAFEELVGSHGGLGGWQTEALLVHPADWDVPDAPLDGMAVHTALCGRLVQLGLRTPEPSETAGADDASDPTLQAAR
ncbi:membrane protein [Marmoricola endophyticus]|uniref:Membrane protein n=1 Tax=Marmoricola endophyticus TaxID=2040280 RepID=A0A917BHV3_9ACTN|nr:alkaline phosphatase family protein [Marmoricola endophyticus]GGF42696.1 membrane protein [Marmoricola endophyticus]